MVTKQKIHEAIAALPYDLTGDAKPFAESTPVMRAWTTKQPLRHQGVLVAGIRGCDGAPKHDPSKHVSRMIRRAVLNPADERETRSRGGFFGFDAELLETNLHAFLDSLDQYPLHYVMHLCHAAEVIGYKHPDREFRTFFLLVYQGMVHKFHMTPETESDMDARLCYDRVAAGTVESDFA